MDKSSLVVAHDLDAAWIIALWKAIHGGDPIPERTVLSEQESIGIAQHAVGVLMGYVGALAAGDAAQVSRAAHDAVGMGIQSVGIELLSKFESAAPSVQPRPYCFKFRGETICVPRPKIATRV